MQVLWSAFKSCICWLLDKGTQTLWTLYCLILLRSCLHLIYWLHFWNTLTDNLTRTRDVFEMVLRLEYPFRCFYGKTLSLFAFQSFCMERTDWFWWFSSIDEKGISVRYDFMQRWQKHCCKEYLVQARDLSSVLLQKVIPPGFDYNLVIHICDVHDKKNTIAKVVFKHSPQDVDGHVVPISGQLFQVLNTSIANDRTLKMMTLRLLGDLWED